MGAVWISQAMQCIGHQEEPFLCTLTGIMLYTWTLPKAVLHKPPVTAPVTVFRRMCYTVQCPCQQEINFHQRKTIPVMR